MALLTLVCDMTLTKPTTYEHMKVGGMVDGHIPSSIVEKTIQSTMFGALCLQVEYIVSIIQNQDHQY